MKVNARTEEFQHIELFDKYALFTNARIDRSTVPKGWYCYDFRGSDDDSGELCYIEKSVTVNHAGSVLMPEKLEIPVSGRLDAQDEIGFLDEGDMTLREFCEMHQILYSEGKEQFHITLYPAGWLEHSYVACCGTSVQPVLERLRQNPKLNMVYLCLDNDEAGEDACESMMEVLADMDVDVERLRPQGKDWNDDLRAKRGGHG